MKTFATALFVAAATAGPAIPASKVCITNDAGFVMNYWFDDVITGEKSASTDNYDIDQTKCLAIADAIPDVTEGSLILTYTKAILGETQTVDTAITYSASAPVASYNCTGTTLDYSCKLNGEADESDEAIARLGAEYATLFFHFYPSE